MRYKILILVICALSMSEVCGQETTDTFDLARRAISTSKLAEAQSLMEAYVVRHPAEKHSTRLIGQVLHLQGKTSHAYEYYNKFFRARGYDPDVKMDYARILFDTGSLKGADTTSAAILSVDPDHAEARIMQGTLAYWKGNYNTAIQHARHILARYPENKDALKLLSQIAEGSDPVTEFAYLYETDSQPLQQHRLRVDHQWSPADRHRVAIMADVRNYLVSDTTSQAAIVSVGDSWQSPYKKWQINARGGLFYHRLKSSTNLTGSLGLSYQPLRDLYISLAGGREPYLYTVESNVLSTVVQDFGRLSVSYENYSRFVGRAEVERRFYTDNNTTTHLSAWVMSPPFQARAVQMRLGYSIAYNTCKVNTFENVRSVQQVIDQYNGEIFYDGIYRPYYTPDGQLIHSAVSSISIQPGTKFSMQLRGFYGFMASLNNPYFYLDIDPVDNLFVARDFQKATYHPWECNLELSYNMTRFTTLTGRGSYYKSFYYDDTNLEMILRHRWHK